MVKKQSSKAYYFKPGQSGNPSGRPKGSRNKISEAFLKDLLEDWEMAGASAIEQCRLVDPAAYLRIAASLVPKNFDSSEENNFSESVLEQFLNKK